MKLPPDLLAIIREHYEKLVGAEQNDGMKKDAAREAIAAALREDSIDVSDTHDLIVDLALSQLDDRDRSTQHDTLQWAADALAGDTILGEDDPILDRVCAVGGGLRKTYRYLDADDLLAIMTRKAAHAAAAAVAASAVADLVRTLLAAMRASGVTMLGDLFGGGS